MNCKLAFVKEEYFKEIAPDFEEMLDSKDIKKQSRRKYIFLRVTYKGNNIFVPLRNKLPSSKYIGEIGYPVPSETRENAGLDFRKILIINDEKYLEYSDCIKIPRSQQHIIDSNYDTIQNKVIKYIEGYIKSALKGRERRDKKYKFSTLHNFQKELGLLKSEV